jgi:hypothetical protein
MDIGCLHLSFTSTRNACTVQVLVVQPLYHTGLASTRCYVKSPYHGIKRGGPKDRYSKHTDSRQPSEPRLNWPPMRYEYKMPFYQRVNAGDPTKLPIYGIMKEPPLLAL